MTRLDGKVAIVTGATSGIGFACASMFAAAGASVVLAGRRATVGEVAVTALERQGATATFMRADVSVAKDVRALVDATIETLGRLDIIVNSAAELAVGGVEDCPEHVWDRTIRVNLKSVYLVARQCIPHLRRAGGGSIVNIASVHAYASQRRMAAYAASKGAIVALTRQMALDYAEDGIRTNALIVGAVDTPMLRSNYSRLGLSDDDVGLNRGPTEVGRIARPDEIAAVALFLASPYSSFINGSPVVVDGGLLARLS